MSSERPITILAGGRSHGRCRYCRRPVVWVTSSPHGKCLPFDAEPLVLSAFENDRGVKFEIIAPDRLHFASCPQRPKRKPSPPWLRSQTSR